MKKIIIKIIKIIIGLCILGYTGLYICFNVISYVNTNLKCKQYIRSNYPNAVVKDIEYEHQVAFIFFGGKTKALLEEDGYEFTVEANNLFTSPATITDYYGSSPHQYFNYEYNDNELFKRVVEFMSNHEIFKKYEFDKSQITMIINDDSSFVTKEKADKNTFEIITINITTDFLYDEATNINIVASDEKHKLIEDISEFLKSEDFKYHQLELSFNFDSDDEESYYIPDVQEIISIYSNEFLKYKNEEYITENNLEDSKLENILNNLDIEGWNIKYKSMINNRDGIRIVIENENESEVLTSNIRDFFVKTNELLTEDYSRIGIKLILEDKSHTENILHTIQYN